MKLEDLVADSKVLQSLIKRRFPRLSDTEVADVGVNHDRLVSLVRNKYNLSDLRARVRVDSFVARVHSMKTSKTGLTGDDDTPDKLEGLFADQQLAHPMFGRGFFKLKDTNRAVVGINPDRLARLVRENYKLSEPRAYIRVGNLVAKLRTTRALGLAGQDDTPYPRPKRR